VQVELMSYTPHPEDTIVGRYILEKGVPLSFDKTDIMRKVAASSPGLLKDVLFDFFVADVPTETLRAFPRYRDSSYAGHREMSRDSAVKIVTSLDAAELIKFFEDNLCSRQSTKPIALVYSMLAAAQLACPNLFVGLAVPCPPGKCDGEAERCRELAREWTKRVQKVIRIAGDAFAASEPNYVMSFDFTEAVGYLATLSVHKC